MICLPCTGTPLIALPVGRQYYFWFLMQSSGSQTYLPQLELILNLYMVEGLLNVHVYVLADDLVVVPVEVSQCDEGLSVVDVQPEHHAGDLGGKHVKVHLQNGGVVEFLVHLQKSLPVTVRYKHRWDVNEVPMTVIGHYDVGGAGLFIVEDHDHVCSLLLGVQYFLSELAGAPLYEEEPPDSLSGRSGEVLVVVGVAELLVLGHYDFADDSLAVGDVAEVGQRVVDGACHFGDCLGRHVDLE